MPSLIPTFSFMLLKPQMEVIVLAQAPREGTFVDNWLEYRTGLIQDQKTRLRGNSRHLVPHGVILL